MFSLCVMRIVLLGVLLAAGQTFSSQCYDEGELEEKILKRHRIQHSEHPDNVPKETKLECPVGLYAGLSKSLKDRSISPWRIVYETKKDRFPVTIAVAQCLCEGCILIKREDNKPWEDFTYNSVTINQSKQFLKKVSCGDGKGYRLQPYSEDVAVGCTCSTPLI